MTVVLVSNATEAKYFSGKTVKKYNKLFLITI